MCNCPMLRTSQTVPQSTQINLTHSSFYPHAALFVVDANDTIRKINKAGQILLGYPVKKDDKIVQLPLWLTDELAKFRASAYLDVAFTKKISCGADDAPLHITLRRKQRRGQHSNIFVLCIVSLMQMKDHKTILQAEVQASEKRFADDLCRMENFKLVSEMAASIGHEIRNPMTSVRGFLQMLGRKADLAEYQSYFTLMIDELDRANQLITEYLSLTKTHRDQKNVENLNTIIDQLYPLLRTNALLADKSVQMELSPIPNLQLNNHEIRQLILNLVKNGLESMQSGKNIMLTTTPLENGGVQLSVRDEGSGIPEEIQDKMGTPFFTTKENGTGIGLPVCYNIAAKNDASIRFETSPLGTVFHVLFSPQAQTASVET